MRAGCIERIVDESQAFGTRLLSKNSFKLAPRKMSDTAGRFMSIINSRETIFAM